MRDKILPGLLLVTVGVIMLVANMLPTAGTAIPAAIGAVFLVAYVLTRNYGFLVPGCILSGLGIGIIVESAGAAGGNGAAVILGLSGGFLLIMVVTLIQQPGTEAGWWPLIPGSILGVIGLAQLMDSTHIIAQVGRWWPLALVVAGVWVLLRSRHAPDPEPGRKEPISPPDRQSTGLAPERQEQGDQERPAEPEEPEQVKRDS